MPLHWTYENIGDANNDLMQGDILVPTPALLDVFRIVHPHFCDRKYLGFMVITQSCDLVRRKESCKADYISLAVIRNLKNVLPRVLDRVCERVSNNGVYVLGTKGKANELLVRVLNQNEQALGLFYLHPEPDYGIDADAVVLLRVGVSLRANEHYEVLRLSRRIRLQAEFRDKLGWLVGNLYSRIGTPDWQEQPDGEKRMRDVIKRLLAPDTFVWVEESCVEEAKKANISLENLTPENALEKLERFRPKPKKDLIVEEVEKQILQVMPKIDGHLLQKISSGLKNSPMLKI